METAITIFLLTEAIIVIVALYLIIRYKPYKTKPNKTIKQ